MAVGHGHSQHAHGSSSSNLGTAFLLNLTFTIIEVIGGLWTNSIAILTDALHDFGDCASLASAWYFQRLSTRGRTASLTYGYGRFSVLGALITGLVLVAGLGVVLWQAIERLQTPESVHAPGMIALAIVGILFNGAAVLRVRRGTSLTERVVSWHLLEDVLGWTAVLIGAVIMTFRDWPVIDPILSILISVFVLFNVVRNLRKVFAVFLQKSPASFDVADFEKWLCSLPDVRSVHHTHVWTIDGEHHVLTTHVVVSPETSRERIAELKETIRGQLDPESFEHVTIDVECEGDQCASSGEH